MTPTTKTQNIIWWCAAILFAIFLSFLSSLVKQLPGQDPINMRLVVYDVGSFILSIAPVVAAGLGLPIIGREYITHLTSKIGKDRAEDVLEQVVDQGTSVAVNVESSLDYDKLADVILERKRQEDAVNTIRK